MFFKKASILWIIINLLYPTLTMAKYKEINLPPPSKEGKISLEEAIYKRRSIRNFSSKDLDLNQIGQLLWSAQGITHQKYGFSFRSAPSAGALYPMEIYILKKDGLFHYLPHKHSLEVISEKDLRRELTVASWGQKSVEEAPLDIVICAVYQRVTKKYGQRGIRYVHMEAGHIAQNIHLQAVALGLGSVPIGAFDDEQIKDILCLPKDLEPLYIIPVGYPQEDEDNL
ncbi:MAG: SagB/ThcOx family dehydrogenase [Candidatus Omnitrophica bacterium]|nr:SagB/ThcOx family dehydrogenase [Candidatus Omnitrophota bacterium]MCM8800070.1 SagB/ThcOx family dehydrogenase [Candidatus Omnitrophota bacterium]